MSISLTKGQKISLTKEAPRLDRVIVGLGWDESKAPFVTTIDCDAFALALKGGRLVSQADIIYYGAKHHVSGTINHMGDNLTGAGEGDDEQIIIDLSQIPSGYDRIVVAVNIYRCVPKKQHFGMISNAFIRLVDASTQKEIARYSLTDDYSDKTAVAFGELYRHGAEWKFNAIGQGTTDASIAEFAKHYQ